MENNEVMSANDELNIDSLSVSFDESTNTSDSTFWSGYDMQSITNKIEIPGIKIPSIEEPPYIGSTSSETKSISVSTHTEEITRGGVVIGKRETVITSDGVTTEATTYYYTDTVVTSPDKSFSDILNEYGLFQNDGISYGINGHAGNSEQQYNAKNSTSYLSSIFYDVGNRNGYLSDFINSSGVINFLNDAVSSFIRQNDYVSFNMADGSNFQAQTGNSSNDIFQYSTDGQNVSYAKLGYQDAINTFLYENGVNFYSGGNFSDILKVIESNPINIYLDGSKGVTYSNIDDIDASESTGDNQLVGNESDNEIHAGSGNSLLWGKGGNDALFGGSGLNTFWYGVHEGNDIVYNSTFDDIINLHNVLLSDIVSAKEIGDDNLLIGMADGGSLRIVGSNGASNFVLGDGSSYIYDRGSHTWTQNSQAVSPNEG